MIKVCIDAGHYWNTEGKRCSKALDKSETREWYLNNRVAVKLQNLLKDYDCEYKRVDDITGNSLVSLDTRANVSDKWKPNVYISIHHNAGANETTSGGTVVYWYSSKAERKGQAETLYNEVVAKTKLVGNRSSKVVKKGLYILTKVDAPAFLIENGFMDSQTDVPIILSDEHAQKTAEGILNFLIKSFGLKKKVANNSKPSELDYEAIGRQFVKAMNEIDNIKSFDDLFAMLESE